MTKSVRTILILGITVSVGMSLSILTALFVYQWEVSQQQNNFQKQIENIKISLQRSLNRYTDVLSFLGDYYGVNQGEIQRQEFTNFVTRSLQTYPGIQALEWADLVTESERLSYEQKIQAEGYPNFQITELTQDIRLIPAQSRPYYLPVTYVVPFQGNEAAFGFDLNSSYPRVTALEAARDTGKIHATGRIRLVQEQRNQYGFLMFLPFYQTTNQPLTSTQRRNQFKGMLVGVFRISDVIEESLAELSYQVDFSLEDRNASADEQFLGCYHALTQTVTTVLDDCTPADNQISRFLCPSNCTRFLTIGQRQWIVKFAPSASYSFSITYRAWASLLIGFLLTFILVLFLYNLQNELTRIKVLNDLKQRFFSIASHELRTPLSTILLCAESLQLNHQNLSESQKQANIERIHHTATQMSQQITDLLTLTRAEVGKLEFQPELLEVIPFCQQAIAEIQAGIVQPIVFQPTSHPKAFWDRKLIGSLLSNLLSNAAKYSPPDTTITVNLHCEDETAVLAVCDRGIGIPPEDRDRVQNPFQRGSNVRDIAGTGLGLAIVQVAVDLHQGKWQIKSTQPQGTTVIVSLPLE